MKREAVNTSFLLAITCLLVYVAVLLTQKPNLQDIDARIEYWHHFYNIEMKRVQRQQVQTVENNSVSDDSSAPISSAAELSDGSASSTPEVGSESEPKTADSDRESNSTDP